MCISGCKDGTWLVVLGQWNFTFRTGGGGGGGGNLAGPVEFSKDVKGPCRPVEKKHKKNIAA